MYIKYLIYKYTHTHTHTHTHTQIEQLKPYQMGILQWAQCSVHTPPPPHTPFPLVCQIFKNTRITTILVLRIIDNIFLIWTHGKKELKKFMKKLNNFTPNVRLRYQSSENSISFLDLKITVLKQNLKTFSYKVSRSPSVPTFCPFLPRIY